jgi:hypothetical protein
MVFEKPQLEDVEIQPRKKELPDKPVKVRERKRLTTEKKEEIEKQVSEKLAETRQQIEVEGEAFTPEDIEKLKASLFRQFTTYPDSLDPQLENIHHYFDGKIQGLLLDVKPAIGAGKEDVEEMKKFLSNNGIQVEAIGNILYDPIQLQKKLEAEVDLAQQFGWDFSKSLEENIEKATGDAATDPENQKLFGYIMGYPPSAIEAYFKREKIRQQGVPNLTVLLETLYDFFKPQEEIEEEFQNEDRERLRELMSQKSFFEQSDLNYSIDQINLAYYNFQLKRDKVKTDKQERKLFEKFMKKIKKELQLIYQTVYNLDEDDTEFMMSERSGYIYLDAKNELDPVYTLKTFNHPDYGGREADDYQELQEKVNQAFTKKS